MVGEKIEVCHYHSCGVVLGGGTQYLGISGLEGVGKEREVRQCVW